MMKIYLIILIITLSACISSEEVEVAEDGLVMVSADTHFAVFVRFFEDGEEKACQEFAPQEIEVNARRGEPEPYGLALYRCGSVLGWDGYRLGSAVYEYRLPSGTRDHEILIEGIGHTMGISSYERGRSVWRFLTVTR